MLGVRSLTLMCPLYMLIAAVTSATMYIRSGSDISGCTMKCLDKEVTLELYKKCGGKDVTLLENHCYHNFTKSHDPRLQLDTDNGCWKLKKAEERDSCVYEVWYYDVPEYKLSSTDIRVLDAVLISNITSNGSRLGEDVAVSVQFSGEESAVTWEVDGEPLPERYRLRDDNRTLIIPGVQRDDAERTFRVRVTNPVSEDTKDYKLIDDPIFSKLQEGEDSDSYGRSRWGLIGVAVTMVVVVKVVAAVCVIYQIRLRRRGSSDTIHNDPENGLPLVTQNASGHMARDSGTGKDGGNHALRTQT